MTQFADGPSKGRKQCPECKNYMGKKTHQCPCGWDFILKKMSRQSTPVASQPVRVDRPIVSRTVAKVSIKGTKECPECYKRCGKRTHQCACGYDFQANTQPRVFVFADGPGKGRKQCPKCKKYMGKRAHQCPCGWDFLLHRMANEPALKVGNVAIPEPTLESRVLYPVPERMVARNSDRSSQGLPPPVSGTLVMQTPSGQCPIPLKGIDVDTVEEWGFELQSHFKKKQQKLSDRALSYFARQYYSFNTNEYKQVVQIIKNAFGPRKQS